MVEKIGFKVGDVVETIKGSHPSIKYGIIKTIYTVNVYNNGGESYIQKPYEAAILVDMIAHKGKRILPSDMAGVALKTSTLFHTNDKCLEPKYQIW